MAKPAELKCQFIVRLPVAMATELKNVADNNRRSMNNQILFYIEKSLQAENKEVAHSV